MIYASTQQMNTARHITLSAERQIKSKTGIRIAVMLCPIENNYYTPEEMLEVIANALGMNPDCYRMKTRMRDVVEMRFIAALLLRMHFPRFTLNQIAILFGGQDHTSILSGLARAHNLIFTGDALFVKKYDTVLTSVNAWLRKVASDHVSAISA
jgi:chromosomal replication initiation ATPase DnaA